MKTLFNRMHFAHQIRTFSVVVSLVIFLLCGSLYLIMADNMTSSSENNTLEYNMQVIENNMDRLISTVNDYSKIISYSDSVQNALKEESVTDYINIQELQEAVIRMASSCEGISSVYLLNNKGEAYIAGNIYEGKSIKEQLQNTTWFQNALKQGNKYSISSEVITYQNTSSIRRKSVSFLRVINNLETLESMGLLVINIPYEKVEETYRSVGNAEGIKIMVLDKNDEIVASSIEEPKLEEKILMSDLDTEQGKYKILDYSGTRYKVGEVIASDGEWKIVCAISRAETLSVMRKYTMFYVLIMAFGIALCIFGTSFITQRISVPLQNILVSMKKVEQGKLERIDIVQVNQEMSQLQEKYNQMIDDTEALMEQKVGEQRQRRKYELSLLQMQIRPHFLYNTFDSVCALAMMGKTDDVYTMMQALGQYYRNSLHKGQEVITVKEELNIVENYLIIQSYRYDDVFQAVYDVDESVKGIPMLKLVLQPLVENAIYHGFRENDLQGTITIRAKDAGHFVKLQVEDDGIGMCEEKLLQIMSDKDASKRFGLHGTVQRIKLYYDNQDLVKIESGIGEGTVITIFLPKEIKE